MMPLALFQGQVWDSVASIYPSAVGGDIYSHQGFSVSLEKAFRQDAFPHGFSPAHASARPALAYRPTKALAPLTGNGIPLFSRFPAGEPLCHIPCQPAAYGPCLLGLPQSPFLLSQKGTVFFPSRPSASSIEQTFSFVKHLFSFLGNFLSLFPDHSFSIAMGAQGGPPFLPPFHPMAAWPDHLLTTYADGKHSLFW